MRARRLGEWQYLSNNGPQSAVFEASKDSRVDLGLFGWRNAPERERTNRRASPHQLTRIDGNLTATADHNDAAIIGQKFRVVGEIHVGEHFQAYGTEICNWHKDHAHAYTFGRSIASPDFENTGCVVLWGHNPSATWLEHATATTAARRHGARIIVVDPRRAGFAARADQWLRVRPGSDGALALGIAGEMIRNNWFDADFVRDWTNGPLLVRTDTERFLRAGELATPPIGAQAEDLLAWDAAQNDLVAYSIPRRTYARSCKKELDASLELVSATGDKIRCRSAFGLYRDLCDAYPPNSVEQLTWVDGHQVTETARLLYASRPVSY